MNTLEEALQWCMEHGVEVLFISSEPTGVQIYDRFFDPYERETIGYGKTFLEAVQDAARTLSTRERE